jgi:ribosomal protein S18 acetylase RimI-like enzyme
MSTEYTLRPSTPDDRPLLKSIYFSTRQKEVSGLGWGPEQTFAFLNQQFEAQDLHYRTYFPDCEFQIVEIENQGAGRLYLDRREDELRIVDIALLPEYRGQGVGERIMQGILDEATGKNLPVRIHVEEGNPAIHLYSRLDFKHVGTEGIHHLMEFKPGKQ